MQKFIKMIALFGTIDIHTGKMRIANPAMNDSRRSQVENNAPF